MIRFDSLKDLHDKLAKIEFLKNKIQLCNDEIVINFHKYFVLEIKLKDFFSVYINSILYYNIEEQDIWESIHEIINEETFNNGAKIEVIPDCLSEGYEYYRFFNLKKGSIHYIVNFRGKELVLRKC